MVENKITKLRKRDGRIVDFDPSKITNAIIKALISVGADKSKAPDLSEKVLLFLNKDFSRKIPEVEQVQDKVEEVLRKEGFKEVAESYHMYRQKRTEIREAKWWLLNNRVKTKLSPNALIVLESRYLRKNEEGKIIETPQDLFKRVARNIAAAEKNYQLDISEEKLFELEESFYRMLVSLEFLPNSPTLMNAGNLLQQLSACFVLPVNDSMEDIFESVKNTALIHKSGGGTGFSFSGLRPKGDMVKSTTGVSSGPVSFMTVFDAATEVIKQGGKRRGANMGILRIDHPDILEFIKAKHEEGKLSNFNISVAVTDDFMERVRHDKEYSLINPRNGQKWKKISAKKIFDIIVHYAWETGDPGVIFIDKINKDNPTPKLGDIESTNPCGEQPLLPYESCNLGSINLYKMIKEGKSGWEIDWDKLKKTVHKAVHFLDNVIDVNRYPLPEIEKISRNNRKIGLGVMGFTDMIIRLGIPYNSPKAPKIAEKVMKFIQEEAKKKSSLLAEKRGVFPNFRDSIYAKEDKKMRNATVTTIAPTGTIGIIADCSSGIEPLFTISFERRNVLGGRNILQVNPVFEEIAKERGFYSKELMKKIAGRSSIQDMEEIPKDVRKLFITTFDISPEDHIKIQAAFQKYVDNSVSKTINFPFKASKEDVKKAYFSAFDRGCKGITIFRTGCRKQQVLNIKKGDKEYSLEEDEVSPEKKDPSPENLPPGSCPTCNI